MEYSDDDGGNEGQKLSRASSLRLGTSVSKPRGDKANNKQTIIERRKENSGPNREKDKEVVENIPHNNGKNVQLGKDKNLKNESVLDRIAIVVATIAVFVALSPHILSFFPSKPDTSANVGPKDIQKLQKVTKELSERVSVLEKELSTIKQFTDHPYHSVSIDENLKVQNRDRETESDLSREINVNRKKLKDLKHEVLTMKYDMNLKLMDIKHMQEEHKEHQAEMVHFNAKVVERLQFVENRTADVSMQISQHNNSLFDLNLHVDNFVSNLHTMNESVKNRLMATKHDMLGRLNTNDMETERLKDVLQKIKEGFQTNITTLETTLEEQSRSAETKNTAMMQQISHQSETLKVLTVSGEAFNKRLSNLDVYVKQHDTNLQSLNVSVENQGRNQVIINGSVQNISSNISSLKVFVESHASSLRNLNASVDRLDINVKRLTENITGISIETLVLDRRTEHIADNIIDKGSLIVAVMIDTILIVLVITYLVARRKTTRYHSEAVESEQLQSPAPYSTAGRILNQVQANRPLQRKLCVISFYEETHPLHMCMTRSVIQQLNQEVEELIIRRHEDILKCPPVYLFFLFVDFNERNVILEDPTLGLGDLRLTTVQAVQKMRGKVIIFYVRDPSSKQLNPMKMYNEDLVSVTKQHELSALNRLSRFISAYDQLTDNQKSHLRQIVVQELSRQ